MVVLILPFEAHCLEVSTVLKRGAADKVLWSQVSSLWSTLLLYSCTALQHTYFGGMPYTCMEGNEGNGTDQEGKRDRGKDNETFIHKCKQNIKVPGGEGGYMNIIGLK